MNTQEVIQSLKSQFASKDWFSDVEPDKFNNIVVYVKYFSSEVIGSVPDKIEGHSILVHFACSKVSNPSQFITDASTWQPAKNKGEWMLDTLQKLGLNDVDLPLIGKPIKSIDPSKSNDHLADDLDRLAKICGDNILQEIFYETHDGSRALTNFSAKYPKVRVEMDRIYAQYGFDAINEEWE